MNWAIPAGIAAVAAVLLATSKAQAATQPDTSTPTTPTTTTGAVVPGGPQWSAYSAGQQTFMKMIITEAKKQGVPVEMALATGEIESGFTNRQNAAGGQSYGPMQVHISNLKAGETVADLQTPAFSIARGVKILRANFVKAKGDSAQTRLYYFCGMWYDDDSCKPATRALVSSKWATACKKWNVKAKYTV